MCAGAIIQSRIPRVVVGCMNPKAGCAGSVLNLLDVQAFNHQAEVKTKVLEEECSLMMKQFFQRASCEAENEKRNHFSLNKSPNTFLTNGPAKQSCQKNAIGKFNAVVSSHTAIN